MPHITHTKVERASGINQLSNLNHSGINYFVFWLAVVVKRCHPGTAKSIAGLDLHKQCFLRRYDVILYATH